MVTILRVGVSCFYHWSKFSNVDKWPLIIALSLVQRNMFQMSQCLLQVPSQNCKKRLLASLCLSNRPSICLSTWKNYSPTGQIFMSFDIWEFFQNLSTKFKFHYNRLRIKGTVREDKYTFMITFCSNVLRRKNV